MHSALQHYSLMDAWCSVCIDICCFLMQDPLISAHVILNIIALLEIVIIYCSVAKSHTLLFYKDA
jgi:hypothetical protein